LIHLPCPDAVYIEAFKRNETVDTDANRMLRNDSSKKSTANTHRSLDLHSTDTNSNSDGQKQSESDTLPLSLTQSVSVDHHFDGSNEECTLSDAESAHPLPPDAASSSSLCTQYRSYSSYSLRSLPATKSKPANATWPCLPAVPSTPPPHHHHEEALDIPPIDHYPLNIDTNEYCHVKVKDKENVVHLTNLDAAQWNEDKIRNVLYQINPYWNKKSIKIYMLQHYQTGSLTVSIEFTKSREYSEKAMELIESNFNLFLSDPNLSNSAIHSLRHRASSLLNVHSVMNFVTGIKLKFYKPSICANRVYSCYGSQTRIPLGFDLKSIIANHYHLYCTVSTKLKYYQNAKLINHIPTNEEVASFVNQCKLPPILRPHHHHANRDKAPSVSQTLILSVYLPFVLCYIVHQQDQFYFYIVGNTLTLYRFDAAQNCYVLLLERAISSSAMSALLYIDILSLIDDTGFYTFYDATNEHFECDLYRKIAHDLNENDINPFRLRTMKLPTSDEELDRCVICLNDLNQFEFTRISCCQHVFHLQCIKQLLLHNKSTMNDEQVWDQSTNSYVTCNFAQCPLCRRKFNMIQSRICVENINDRPHQRPTVQFVNVSDIELICDDSEVDEEEEDDEDEEDEDDEEQENEENEDEEHEDEDEEDEDEEDGENEEKAQSEEEEKELDNEEEEEAIEEFEASDLNINLSEVGDYNDYDVHHSNDSVESLPMPEPHDVFHEEEDIELEMNEDEYNEDASSYYGSYER